MDHLTLDSWFRRFAIAGTAPERGGSADPPETPAREEWFRKAAAAGVSARDVAKLAPPGINGTSPSNYSRWFVKDSDKRFEKLKARPFDAEGEPPVVALFIDATHFKKQGKQREAAAERAGVAKQDKTWTVTIVVGLRADGSRIALTAGVTPGEHSVPIHSLLEDVIDRGVDRRVVVVADQGEGIRAAVEKLTRSKNPPLQICTTHAGGIVKNKLPEAMRAEVAKQLKGAWEQDDPQNALELLESVAADLQKQGFEGAAKSVRRFAKGTVLVQQLGLTGAARVFLRSTNSQEGTNALVKLTGSLPKVSRWSDEEMLMRWVAWQLLEFEETRWNRAPEPEQYLELAEQRFTDFHGVEALRAQLPPSMTIESLPVSFEHDEQMLATATRWWEEHPEATWVGSAGTLAALGLAPGEEVTPGALLEAMRCYGPDGRRLRTGKKISFPARVADGEPIEVLVDGIRDARWELKASPALMDRWRQGGEAAADAERWLLEAVPAAVEQATLTTTPHHGFAGVMALRRPSEADPDRPLSVEGITFAVQRGKKAKLEAPASKEMRRPRNARAAEDAAAKVLTERLGEAAERSGHGREGSDSEPSAALLAGIETAALDHVPALVDVGDEQLGALVDRADDARAGLRSIDAEVSDWWEADWQEAAQQIAAARLRSYPRVPNDPWWPLDRQQRLLLGEERAQGLLDAAAMLEGLAAADAEAARELLAASADPLARLRGPVERARNAATALAAEREHSRRELFTRAREGSGQAPSPKLRYGDGAFVAGPIDRYRRALDPVLARSLDRYAQALGGQMRALDQGALRRLAAATATPWGDFDARAGLRLAGLRRHRDTALGKRLRALRDLGAETASGVKAEAAMDGAATIEASDAAAAARSRADRSQQELDELETQIGEMGSASGGSRSPLSARPEAAIHHAALVELVRRERERELAEVSSKPLRDSLTASLGLLGSGTASAIKRAADREATTLELHQLSDTALREALTGEDPFAALPTSPHPGAVDRWRQRHGPAAVRRAAIEGQLIDNAVRDYAALAERESARRGSALPNPIEVVRAARGEEFAGKVARRAAVLASHLDSIPERDRPARTAALRREIARVGLGKANFGAIAQAVALQHGRNLTNEQEAVRRAEVASAVEVGAGVDIGAGM